QRFNERLPKKELRQKEDSKSSEAKKWRMYFKNSILPLNSLKSRSEAREPYANKTVSDNNRLVVALRAPDEIGGNSDPSHASRIRDYRKG
ncbi:MAG: hypothetical protein ACXVJ1_16630, partial [Candidatus Angelobacter sp.]